MKKTFLLICALIASIGVMAQFTAPSAAPTDPTDLTRNVVVVYSNYYGMGLSNNLYGNTWGGGPVSPFWSTLEQPVIVGERKVLHVTGTAFSHRLTKYNDRNTWVTLNGNTTYNKVHVAVYPKTATTLYIYKDGGWSDADKVSVAVTPGQWNVVEQDVPATWTKDYYCVALMNGEAVETEFYMDDFYFSKPNVEDTEAPVLNTASLKSAGVCSAVLTLKATDNISSTITYVITDQDSKVYNVEGASGTQIDYVISPLENKEYTFSVVAKDESENASDAQNVVVTPLALPESPAPDKPAADVLSIYSDAYTPALTWADGSWGQSTVKTEKVVNENHILQFTKYNYFGFDEWSTQLDLSGMDYVHIDVLPDRAITLRITPIMMTGGTPVENAISVGDLTVGQWNSMDVKLSDFGLDLANYKAFQIKIDNGHGTEMVYVDNIYFWKASAIDVTSLSIESASDEIVIGKTLQLTVKNQSEVEVPATQLTFESSSDAIATVNESGLVTAVAGGTATITVTSKTNPSVSQTKEITIVGPTTAPAAPTADAANVIAIYSETYGKVGVKEHDPAWGGGPSPLWTSCEDVTISEHKMKHVVGTGYADRPAVAITTDYIKACVALYPKTATSGKLYADGQYGKAATFTLTPNQWNYIEVAFKYEINYVGVELVGEEEFYLDHFYVSKPAEGEAEVVVSGDKAIVAGTVTAAYATTIQTKAGKAAVLDMSGATITEDITLTPANQNAVVVVRGTKRTPNESGAHVTAPNLVVFDGTYYCAKDGVVINLVDDNEAQPAYDFVINAQQDGFTYTRTVAAGAWVSYNSPAPVTIPEGVIIYKATDATSEGVTFTKQASQALDANDPVVLHNTTGAAVIITTSNRKGDLNLTANGAGTEIASGIKQIGTAKAVAADGSQFALKDGEFHPFNAGATIGAFRVYLTGLTPSGARAIFFDGDVTGINSIENGKQKNDDVWYDLQGRRIGQGSMANGQLKPGLYIVNGKKVIIK